MKKRMLSFCMIILFSIFQCTCLLAAEPEMYADAECVATDSDAVTDSAAVTDLYAATVTDSAVNGLAAEIPYNYIDTGARIDYYIPADEMPALYSAAVPPFYDSREAGYVTSVKNQLPHGTCWAFAALGAGESSLLARGMSDTVSTMDFSEYQLAYFFYHHADDAFGNLTGDMAFPVSQDYLSVGGNNYYTLFELAAWYGASDEAKAPYENISVTSVLDDSLAFDDVAHLQEAYIVSMENMDEVKKLIMNYGAVASAVYMNTYYYFNADQAALCQNATDKSNHAIMVIGWDDSFAVENFNANCRPDAPGAWLIKNSWGADIEYFWVSYEDACLSGQDAFAFVMEPADNYDFNYQYDGTYGDSSYRVYSGNSMANVFTVKGRDTEQLEAVSVALKSDNVKYSVQIYRNPQEGDPCSGMPMLAEPLVGYTTYAGYYTETLGEPVTLQKGDRFSVVYTFESQAENRSYVDCYVASSVAYSWIEFVSHSERGQSYFCKADGTVEDLYDKYPDKGITPRIKAFTSGVGEEVKISADEFIVSEVADREYTGKNIQPSPPVKYQGRKLVRNVDYTLSYSNNKKPGTAEITVTGIGKYTGTKKLTFKILAKSEPVTVYGGVDYDPVYDYIYYTDKYPEVVKKCGADDAAVLAYFVNHGMSEGQQAKASFDVTSYAYQYPDLRRIYGNNLKSYYLHYINYGKKEGRRASGITKAENYQTVYEGVDYSAVYDYNYYVKLYGDVKRVYGLDDAAVLRHFVNFGMKEGRRGSLEFSVGKYKSRYADLRKAYKTDLKAYYLHYINHGKRENRTAR